MISVLMPTRGRPNDAVESILSLGENANDSDLIEYAVRLDDDDPDPLYLTEGFEFLRESTGPRHGYANLHRYYNELAARATGDHLLLWNDDARMLTPGWDTIIREHLDPAVPAVGTPNGGDHPFPVITRALYEILGHFSLNPHCDHWLCEIGKAAGCMVELPGLEIAHLRDELDDETKREGVTAQETVTLPALASEETRALLAGDVAKVRAALGVAA